MTARRGPARHAAGRVLPYGRRRDQDVLDEPEPPDEDAYYPEVTEPRAARRPEPAPSRPEPAPRRPEPASSRPEPAPVTRETWLRLGQMQFDYLIGHGLQPGDRMLEIGCGNLRAGHLFIDYLSAGNYYGIDTSPENLIAAQQVIIEFRLQSKMPHLTLFGDLRLGFLPASKFTVVQAHSLFSRLPIEVIGECLAHVSRVMTRDAIFDFTFDRTQGVEHQPFRENFYYRTDTLIDIADSHGLDAELMKDWEQLGNPHSKIRVIRRS